MSTMLSALEVIIYRAHGLPEGDSQMTGRHQRGWLKTEKRSRGGIAVRRAGASTGFGAM
jgi:hypothetical protein